MRSNEEIWGSGYRPEMSVLRPSPCLISKPLRVYSFVDERSTWFGQS